MIKPTLTVRHSELLFEIAEIHTKWYLQFYEDVPPFDVLLELNSAKLSHMIDSNSTEKEITEALNKLKSFYIDKINSNNNYNEI